MTQSRMSRMAGALIASTLAFAPTAANARPPGSANDQANDRGQAVVRRGSDGPIDATRGCLGAAKRHDVLPDVEDRGRRALAAIRLTARRDARVGADRVFSPGSCVARHPGPVSLACRCPPARHRGLAWPAAQPGPARARLGPALDHARAATASQRPSRGWVRRGRARPY